MLDEGRESFSRQQWEAGVSVLMRTYELAAQDSLIRDQVVAELVQASQACVDRDWQASNMILQRLAEIQPDAASTRDLQARVQHNQREEAITRAIAAVNSKHNTADLQGALREIQQALQICPGERRLLEFQAALEEQLQQAQEKARREEERRKEEAFVSDALSRAQRTLVLEERVHVLEEALGQKPREIRLQRELSAARELNNHVAGLVSEAREFEQAGQYDQALAKWETLAVAYPKYPDLEQFLSQARQRRQQARLEAKANYLTMLQNALASAKYDQVESVLADARRYFPGDKELEEIEARADKGLARRRQAEKLLDEASDALDRERWKKSLELFRKADEKANPDPIVRERVVQSLLAAAETALRSDQSASEMFAAEAARIEPDSPMLASARSRIDARKRALAVEECLATVERCISRGDWQGALHCIDRGLADSPREAQLLAARERVEAELRRINEELLERKAREQQQEQQRREQAAARHPTPRENQTSEALREAMPAWTAPPAASLDTRTDLGSDLLNADRLQLIERQLTSVIGPMAKVLVKRSAARTTSTLELYSILAESLEPEDRQAFLAKQAELGRGAAHDTSSKGVSEETGPATSVPVPASAADEITPTAVERAALALAAHLGPIANVLTRKEARRAGTVGNLYRLLAEHVDSSERERFLRMAGIDVKIPSPGLSRSESDS
jgi:tetratricopeptide (TPR) repeat protein